jgi:uncharacterized protein
MLVNIEGLGMARSYKPSCFNAHTKAPDGTLIVYNSYSGRHCAIPASSAALAEQYLSQTGTMGPLDLMGQYLLDRGYMVESTVDEAALWDVRYGLTQFRTDVFELILLPSEDCNFRCVYCSQEFKRGSMAPAVRRGVINLVKSKISTIKSLKIRWFGGEPLLGYDAIEEIAPALKSMADEAEVTITSGITTNGFLLTEERAKAMLQSGIRDYQITIDGAGELHDRHRPLKEGGSTYEYIVNNLVRMKNFVEPFNVGIRVNFDKTNVACMEPLFDSLARRLECDQRFRLDFYPVGKWGGAQDDQLEVCGQRDIINSKATLADEARKRGLKTESLAVGLDPFGDMVCYAARPFNFVVGADGKLMKCTVVLDTLESNIVGHLMESGQMKLKDAVLAPWIRPYFRSDASCSKCFFTPVCQGASCPLPRITGGDRPCPPHKKLIQQTLVGLWEEKKESQKLKLVRISNGVPAAPAGPEVPVGS